MAGIEEIEHADFLEPADAGHSLVESVVALALLLTVLTPLAGALAVFVGQHHVERQTLALAAGRRQLESMLADSAAWPDSAVVDAGFFRVVRRVRYEGRLARYSVDVYWRDAAQPLVTLSTWRFMP